MPRVQLTDKAVAKTAPAAAGKRRDVWDAIVPGMALRVTDTGVRSFVVMKRLPGAKTPVRRTLGTYPALSLAKARELARLALEDIAAGVDPKIRQAEARAAEDRARNDTFAWAYRKFDAAHICSKRSGTQDEMRRTLEKRCLPRWRNRALSSITRRDISDLLDDIATKAPVAANRAQTILGTFFRFCVGRGYIVGNPIAGMGRMANEGQGRDRKLTDDEIRAIWRACDEVPQPFGPFVRMLFLTAQRRNEIATMERAHIDWDRKTWTIPAHLTKANREHRVPLSDPAISMLTELKQTGGFYFTTNGKTPISGFSKWKAALDEKSNVADWTLHDIRRTVATRLEALGFSDAAIKAVLNHSPRTDKGVTARYARHDYIEEKKVALATWAQRLSLVLNPQPAEVIELRGSSETAMRLS